MKTVSDCRLRRFATAFSGRTATSLSKSRQTLDSEKSFRIFTASGSDETDGTIDRSHPFKEHDHRATLEKPGLITVVSIISSLGRQRSQ